MQRVKALLEQVADTDVTVLIQGESGSGKEIVARTLHAVSARAHERFVKVNCAALPEDLLESELFGYEKGAFTGAGARKQGKFEQAHGGTIFLDEIGEMSPALQAKLLQVLQDGRFSRLGGNLEIAVDVRVVCATNRKLDAMVREGTFREDLFFRLNVVTVTLPPLRERREEIPTLVANFLRSFAARYRKPLPRLSDRLMRAFERYAFPGNVRELENMMKRIIVLESESQILDEVLRADRSGRPPGSSLLRLIEEIEATAGADPPARGRPARRAGGRARDHRPRAPPHPLEPQAGGPPARCELQDAAPEDPRVRARNPSENSPDPGGGQRNRVRTRLRAGERTARPSPRCRWPCGTTPSARCADARSSPSSAPAWPATPKTPRPSACDPFLRIPALACGRAPRSSRPPDAPRRGPICSPASSRS